MKTQGEIEAAISEGISRFEQDYMGRGPKDIHTHLLGDLLVIRLQGVLTAAERHLVESLPAEKGRDLLKQALDLPFAEVGEVTELKGDGCDYRTYDGNDPLRWLAIQARQHVETGGTH
jgi:hypothetical protein